MMKTRNKIIWIIVGLIASLLWIYPFWIIVINSLKSQIGIFSDTLGLPKQFVWSNYPTSLSQLDIISTGLSSLLITISALILLILASSMAAYALSRNRRKLSSGIYFLIAVGLLVPFQAIMIPLVAQFGQANMLNRPGLIFMYVGLGTSMATFLYYGALRGIPMALDEAAIMDGANPFQVYWRVIMPLLSPTTVTVIVLNSLWFWNDYLLPSITINRPGMLTIPLKMFQFFGTFGTQWNMALPALVIVVLPIIILFVILQRWVVKGITEGATK